MTSSNTSYKGIIFRKDIGFGKIISITYPDDFEDVFVVDANSLEDKNYFDIEGSLYPVFAKDAILYPTQPLFAAFGSTKEKVELFCNKVVVELDKSEAPEISETKTFEFNSHSTDFFFEEDNPNYEAFSSKFTIRRHMENLSSERKVSVSFENGILNVDVESLWPNHIKHTLAKLFNLSEESVNLSSPDAREDFDQLAIKPLVVVIPASFAAIHKGCNVEISEDLTSVHPQIQFKIDSVLDKSTSELVATKALVNVDIGSVFIFEEELATSLFSGLTNMYKNQANEVCIELVRTNNPPSNFYRGLGHAPSVAAMEHHIGLVANSLNILPNTWRTDNIDLSDDAQYHDVLFLGKPDLLKKTIESVVKHSSYERRYSAYNQKNISGHINPSLNYTRGIGLASSAGISGLSSMFVKNRDYQISASLNEDNSFNFNCGIYSNEDIKGIWKGIVKETFPEIPVSNIIIESSSDKVQDLGPAILSRTTTFMSKILESLCFTIKEKRDKNESYPIQAFFNTGTSLTLDTLYDVDSFGSVCIDLYIDPVKLTPVIYNVDAGFALGNTRNREKIRKKLRQIISHTITDVCPDATLDYNLYLSLSENPNLSPGTSISLARGITLAALSLALSQALKHNIYKLPLLAEDIVKIIKQKEMETK